MIHLYVKEHNQTGLKYFGRTYRNPFVYKGSGTRWLKHLKAHTNDVTTTHVWSYTDDQLQEAITFSLEFSKSNNIVESDQWANLVFENVIDGGMFGYVVSEETRAKKAKASTGHKHTQKTKDFISQLHTGQILTNEHKEKISKIHKGKQLTPVHIQSLKDHNIGKVLTVEHKNKIRESHLGSVKTEEHKAKISASLKGRKLSEETKLKMSLARQKRIVNEVSN